MGHLLILFFPYGGSRVLYSMHALSALLSAHCNLIKNRTRSKHISPSRQAQNHTSPNTRARSPDRHQSPQVLVGSACGVCVCVSNAVCARNKAPQNGRTRRRFVLFGFFSPPGSPLTNILCSARHTRLHLLACAHSFKILCFMQ